MSISISPYPEEQIASTNPDPEEQIVSSSQPSSSLPHHHFNCEFFTTPTSHISSSDLVQIEEVKTKKGSCEFSTSPTSGPSSPPPHLSVRLVCETSDRVSGNPIVEDRSPKYYDVKLRQFIGKQARKNQTWSIAGYLMAKMMLEDPSHLGMIALEEEEQMKPQMKRSALWVC
ncbi:hypothetical protein OSB04_028844 [Centaurea solstitialis]|uniref:Uncharacterized protein n=1 Tax=Centaurea solstitialis TaxID=347529 RepID=A0AA38SHB1_9ASTR|nr:hypothetical protein OSB04_028844 [Centaurea solstitialis]